jgi:hypothetical protein
MAVPTWTVEIAFASDPLGTPTWVDVSAYVLTDGAGPGIRIERGRTSPLDDFRTGRASFRLLNTDRRYDPLHASGPYFGQLLPGKQVRIRATANAVTTDQFRGFVRGWPQSFDDAGYWAYVDVECYDGLGWLSEARATGDVVAVALSGVSYERSAGRFLVETGSLATESYTLNLEAVANVFDGRTVAFAGGSNDVSFWFRTGATTASTLFSAPGYDSTAGAATSNYVKLTSAGLLEVSTHTVISSPYTVLGRVERTTTAWNDGLWHHVAIGQGSSEFDIYIDGRRQPTTVITASRADGIDLNLNLNRCGALATQAANGNVTFSEFLLGSVMDAISFDTPGTLTATIASDLYRVGVGTFTETTTARAGRILDAVGWPSAWRDLTTEPYGTCTTPPFNGAQAMNLLRDVERTEQGRLFAAKDGDITLQHRYFTTEETRGNTIQATFSDDGSDITYQAGGYDQDVDDVLNAVTVSLASVASSESTNSTSITAYGRKSDTINTLLPNLDLALSMAQGVVLQRKDVLTRIRPVEPSIDQTAANWSTLLGLEIGDHVRLEMTPSRTGSQLQQSATVEGISIEAHLSHTRASFEAAPIPAVNWFQVGSSEVGGTHVVAF